MTTKKNTETLSKISGSRDRRRGPKAATPERLEKAALSYLERFATSAENLRRVLMRRVEKSARLHDTDSAALADAVANLIARYRRAGLLDDQAYATARAASLHRAGKSMRYIRQSLAQKGVGPDDCDAAIATLQDEVPADTDLSAAVNYARRRRIGPWRPQGREEARQKDLSALGRQGFSYEIARRIVEAETPDQLEDETTC
ncbi:MAG: regulatory protein RecX [Alphaproteobacteria bacterium]